MEPLTYIPTNVTQLNYSDYNFQTETTSALSFWKVYGKCTRKSDNKSFSYVIIPDKKYLESCLEFLDQVYHFEHKQFLRCIGYINELDNTKEITWYHQILVFEEFRCTLAQFTLDNYLTKAEFEELTNSLVEATRFLTRDIGSVFPRFSPDCIAVIKSTSLKATFKIIDMFFIKGIPGMLPFEDTKWLAPEIYVLYPTIQSMTNSIKKNPLSESEDYSKSLLFSAGLVLLFTGSKSNFQEKRKNVKTAEELPKIWGQEAAILDLAMTKIRTRYSYPKEDTFMQILHGVTHHELESRVDLETIRALGMSTGPLGNLMGDPGDSFEDIGGFTTNMKKSDPPKLPTIKDESVLPNIRKPDTNDDPYLFKAADFVEVEKRGILTIYSEKNKPNVLFSGIKHPVSDIQPAKGDGYIRSLLSLEKIDCFGLLKFAGYYYEDEIRRNTLIVLFESHSGSLADYLTTKELDKEMLSNLVKSLVEAFYSIHSQKAFSPPFISPDHILFIQNKTSSQIKFKFLLASDASVNEYREWLSPELFLGEVIREKPQSLIYSFALVLLHAVLKNNPTGFRTQLKDPIDANQFKSKEIEMIKQALVDFKKKIQIEKSNLDPNSFESKLNTLIAQSLEMKPFHRTDVISWNLEQSSFSLKNASKDMKSSATNLKGNDDNKKPIESVQKLKPIEPVQKPKPKKSFFCCGSSKPKKSKGEDNNANRA